MSNEVKLNKTVYNKDIYLKTIDTKFKQLGVKTIQEQIDTEITVDQFFEIYNELFFDIPERGNTNSHEFLITQSSTYIEFKGNTEEVEALQKEIAQLRQELLESQQQLLNQSNLSPSQTSTI